MKRPALLSAAYASCLTISAAVPLRWTVETSANPQTPATFDQFAGATYDLEAALQSRGKPLAVDGDAKLYWQTNGMGSAWWTAPATVSGNVLRATWTPACDVGARVYNCFIGITGTVYNAAFQLRLRPSPGAFPNALPLPTPVIDFSRVTVLNPPWSGGGSGGVDTNAVELIANAAVETNAVTIALIKATNNLTKAVGGKFDRIGGKIGPDDDDSASFSFGNMQGDALHVSESGGAMFSTSVEIRGFGGATLSVESDDDAHPASITKDGKEVATEEYVDNHVSPPSPTLRLHDEVLDCWWIIKIVNGVMTREVE